MLWPISPFILGHRLSVKPLVDNICEGLLPKSCVLLQQQYRESIPYFTPVYLVPAH